MRDDKQIAKKGMKISIELKNIGNYIVDEVPQLYLTTPGAGLNMPLNTLVGFKRVTLRPNETKIVEFEITPDMLKMVDDNGKKVLLKGKYKLTVSGCAPCNKSLDLGIKGQIVEFKI